MWLLGIGWMINILALSPNTQYATYLVFKMIDAEGFQNCPLELSVGVGGSHNSTEIVCYDPNVEGRLHNRVSQRRDGWLEIEIREFFNSGQEDEVLMNVKQRDYWKKDLLLAGIEVRPK
ncbi:F-box protein PP2-B10 [Medicago truncatula]|nr:F-box protein PP2-B10 [Medicago truncatula]